MVGIEEVKPEIYADIRGLLELRLNPKDMNDLDNATFQFIKIEMDFYTNGQKLEEEHFINNKNVFWTCWDSTGNEKPIEYLKTIKSVSVDDPK
jgi:hypothetical protein